MQKRVTHDQKPVPIVVPRLDGETVTAYIRDLNGDGLADVVGTHNRVALWVAPEFKENTEYRDEI